MGPPKTSVRGLGLTRVTTSQNGGHEDLPEDSGCINLLGSIRTSLSAFPIRSLFSPPQLKDSGAESTSIPDPRSASTDNAIKGQIMPLMTHRVSFFDEAMRIIKDISPNRLRSRSGSLNSGHAQVAPLTTSTRSRSHSIHLISSGSVHVRPSMSGISGLSDATTPTLTPGSSQAQSIPDLDFLASWKSPSEFPEDTAVAQYNDSHDCVRSRKESEMIKAGKKPQRPNLYDAHSTDFTVEDQTNGVPIYVNEEEDWCGMEELLELSRRERRASDSSPVIGQSSKSIDAWMAMHQDWHYGSTDYLARAYYRWRRWHEDLDNKLQKQKRVIRIFQFLRQSKEAADIYVEYWYKRRWLEAMEANSDDPESTATAVALREELTYLSNSYYRLVKHSVEWRLKTSRSLSCLRELDYFQHRDLAD